MGLNPKQAFMGLGGVLAIAVMADLGASIARKASMPPPKASGPHRTYDPASMAVHLEGERREKWLKRSPLKVGETISSLTIRGVDAKELTIPAKDGKPSVVIFTNAARNTVPVLQPIRKFVEYYGDRTHIALVIMNTASIPWEEYSKEFANTSLIRVWDKDGSVFEKLRPAGKTPEGLPAFWGFDGKGRLVYFQQPQDVYQAWARPLRIALGYPKPKAESTFP